MTLTTFCCGFFLVHTLHISFGFVWHLADAKNRSSSERPRMRQYFVAWLREWWWTFIGILIYPLGFWPRLIHPRVDEIDPQQAPIILVHGYAVNWSCMLVIYWRLKRLGYHNIYPLNLTPLWGSIETIAEELSRAITQISERHGGQAVYAICHSMGGIVVRTCIEQTPSLPLAKLITIASPHLGTRIAHLAVGKNGAQLRPHAPFWQQRKHFDHVPIVSIYSDLDNLVLPASSAAYGSKIVRFDHCGHNTTLMDKRIFATIVGELPAALGIVMGKK